MKTYIPPEYIVERDITRCNKCKICVEECTYYVHFYSSEKDEVSSLNQNCINCQRCVVFCPKQAITIRRNPNLYREKFHWTHETIFTIKKQAETGSVVLTGMGCDKPHMTYWDKLLINASQVTNPSIDPLREPIEIRKYLGKKPKKLEFKNNGDTVSLKTDIAPQLLLETPIMFAAMSYGAVNLNVHKALAMAAAECGTYFNCGEGGLHPSLHHYGKHTIVQVASGRFGVNIDYLKVGAAVEIKIGQGAKPGIGGHLPGEKVNDEIAKTRMIPVGTDALSPAPHHDIYSIEDLKQLVYALKEVTDYKKPVAVKIAAVHNIAAIASGVVHSGADILVVDGVRGSTGAAPKVIRDNVGIPIELALASVDKRLRDEGIRGEVSIVASGGIRNSADLVKAIALGADAVYIGTAALIAIGCTLCQKCYTGKCPWGITTTDPKLARRVDPVAASKRLVNLITAWSIEIKEILGGMGMNYIESLRGNREQLRGVELTENELKVLGVKPAGY